MKLSEQTKTRLRWLWLLLEVVVIVWALSDLARRNPSYLEMLAPAGTVVKKERQGQGYHITVKAYGKFLVTKKEYEQIEIGDKLPKFLIERSQ